MTVGRRGVHRKPSRGKNPRGSLLAFIAATVQAMLPFIVAAQIVVPANLFHAGTPICSSVQTLVEPNAGTAGHGNNGASCPICIALAASQAFTAPLPILAPLPLARALGIAVPLETKRLHLLGDFAYRSRGPPAIA